MDHPTQVRQLSKHIVNWFGGPDPYNSRADRVFDSIYGYSNTGFSKLVFRNNQGTKAVYVRSLREPYNISYIDRTFDVNGVLEDFYYPLNENLGLNAYYYYESFCVEFYNLQNTHFSRDMQGKISL